MADLAVESLVRAAVPGGAEAVPELEPMAAGPAVAEVDLESARLVRLARQGDRDAFAGLVGRHQQSAWRVAMAALGRPEEAEDAAQDGFISAWRNLEHLRDDDRFRPWLLSIVWRKALDRRRGLKSWLKLVNPGAAPQGDAPAWTVEDSPDHGPSPETAALAKSAAQATRRLIHALPKKLRDPLLLAASGEYRYEEIARMLAIPIGTVKWRVSEARRIVREKLDRMDGVRRTGGES
ncbi:MAG: RNA polymerase sigma factor [Acidobacteriota bacterium]|nr:RNA polymerase sigma factor [Acidobacteriota bacterium]